MKRSPTTVCFPFIGDDVGGSHISAIKLIQGLNRQRFNPIIVLHDETAELANLLTRKGLSFIRAPDVQLMQSRRMAGNGQQGSSIWTYLTNTLPKLRSFLRNHDVDIVHTNDGRIHANWAIAARTAGAKLLWHHRGDPDANGVNILAPLLANHIVTVSNFSRPRRPILPVRHKTTVVHSPFDHPTMTDRLQAHKAFASELDLPPETRFLGYFGGLIDRKRPVKFVEIVHAFIKRHPEIPVAGLIFGISPPDGPPLEEAVRDRALRLGISGNIHLMGFRQPVEPCMCAVDILLVPAVNEPFGRTLIEAMFLGTPVVATNHGGNPEAIADGENGFLVEPENPETFVAPIHRLLTDRTCWQRTSDTAQRQALSSYSVAKHIDSIAAIYERLFLQPANRVTAAASGREPEA